MSLEMYRHTTLGKTLEETVREFIEDGQIPESLGRRIMAVYDKAVSRVLGTRAHNKVTFTIILIKAEKLRTYRFCDNVWTLLLHNVEFRGTTPMVDGPVKRLKIVACDTAIQRRAI
ncbi:Transcription initiation factor IIA subunit 2 [Aphelenchoides besseyi]|nr:Transcription initiation factor IIA subunit 2 [Aphelenchoides besseyi]